VASGIAPSTSLLTLDIAIPDTRVMARSWRARPDSGLFVYVRAIL
jgi:hypothetical protein